MACETGYGVASVPGVSGPARPDTVESVALSDRLGCTDACVDVHVIPAGASLSSSPGRERLVVPLGPADSGALGGTLSLSARTVGRVPADHPWTIEADTDAVVLAIDTTAAGGADDPATVDLTAAEYRDPSTSDVATAHLTGALGCAGLKVNARRLAPGQAVPLHTEGTQEEIFVPLDDGGSMRVGDETVQTPRGTVVRVAPATPRSAQTHGDAATVWLMVGAPPTGGTTDWDPGATILEDSDAATTVQTDRCER